MNERRIAQVLAEGTGGESLTLSGWVRTKRDAKKMVFFELNDGSCLANLQVIVDKEGEYAVTAEVLADLQTGASVEVTGVLAASPGREQRVEMQARSIRVVGVADPESYPLQKKRHSFEYLREIAHLRPRTNTFGAVMRVRNTISFAIHRFFQERGFVYLNTPIIASCDAEGAGQMFQVTTLDLDGLGRSGTSPDYRKDFFGRKTYLTVTGQLQAEVYAEALERVYTFGPTFRAENSNTTRHLAEFWMVEPEMAFCDMNCNMQVAEEFLRYVFGAVLETNEEDMRFFDQRILPGVLETITHVAQTSFAHCTYTDAMRELERAPVDFEFPVAWGSDLQSEHERYLTETVFKGPVIVTDYPREIKAFYMRLNDDERTVQAMDVLVPRLGEVIGGSVREERLHVLEGRIDEAGLSRDDYWWYLDLRRFGTVPHAGFGLGLERLVQYVTGMANIRDVIPFPRTVGTAEF